jgi:hypothetical protein
MPVTTTYLKVVRGQAIVKVVGDGATATIDIGSNIKLADETFAGYGSANVTINSVLWSSTDVNAPILIKRPANGANVMILHGNDNWSMSQMMGFVDSSNSTANIAITMPAGGGTVYLGLSKVDGYTPPNQQVITKVTG